MDIANLRFAEYCARAGHPVHTVAHHADQSLLALPGVVFHRAARPLHADLLGMPFLRRAGLRVAAAVAKAGGRVVVNGGNCQWPDVNWVHYVHAAYRPSSATGLARRAKAAIAHASFLQRERQAITKARLVIANSNRTKKDLIEYLSVDPERILTVYYGCDAAFAPPDAAERAEARSKMGWMDDRPRVAFIGALGDRRKGFDTAFEAWRILCRQSSWDADLIVIGRGAELPQWKQRAADAGLVNRIHFLGFRKDVPLILRACDALVAPTRYEAYGLGVQEALCCGLPAIVSADAGVAERYPVDLNGLLLQDANNSAELASRLNRWREDLSGMSTKVRSLSQQLRLRSWDTMAGEILSAMQ
ncbi:MAG: glycosyltransferase family 4 protein [Phycisphaerae bacterium]|nr:glycosyltransferase family 4 protein [Phycisphaerae bacterium]